VATCARHESCRMTKRGRWCFGSNFLQLARINLRGCFQKRGRVQAEGVNLGPCSWALSEKSSTQDALAFACRRATIFAAADELWPGRGGSCSGPCGTEPDHQIATQPMRVHVDRTEMEDRARPNVRTGSDVADGQ
jgi:hypothetical protein